MRAVVCLGRPLIWSAAVGGALLAGALAHAQDTASSDSLACRDDDGTVACQVDLRDFFGDEIREVLNNGWENTLEFQLAIVDAEDEIVAMTFTSLTQRCYIDPFDDPCLALWRGAETWDTHDDIEGLIDAISEFELVSVASEELPGGEYTAQLIVELNPITDKQVAVIRSWLARHRGGHLVVGKNESSIFGTFVSVFANVKPGHAEAGVTLAAEPFTVTSTATPTDPTPPPESPE